jgi:hypothetical protein
VTPHEEIRNLLQCYGRAADDRDLEQLTGLFHPEAEVTGARGTQSREQWLEAMRAPRTFPTSMHFIGEPVIELAEGAAEASTDTYAVVYQVGDRAAGQDDLTLGMRYRDRVVREDDRWLIRSRTSTVVWMR